MRIDQEMLRERNRDRSDVPACNGMVCTSQPLATMAGLDILQRGGNAIDAAICANAMLTVVEPMNCGPGGDLFAIVWSEKQQRLFGLNASGRSPAKWNLEAAKKRGIEAIPPYDVLAWSVPGCVSGWAALSGRFGKLRRSELLAPAISYARHGFCLSPLIANAWAFDADRFKSLAKAFAPSGRMPQFGDMVTNTGLAAALQTLARKGWREFYEGEIASRIAACSAEYGGLLSEEDLARHEAEWVDPVSAAYRGYTLWELPPNGQGIAALQIMNMLEHFDIAGLEPNGPEHLHLFIEAKKLAFEDRAMYYADMGFADVPVEWLISKEYAAQRVQRIDRERASHHVEAGTPPGGDTIYLCTADEDGNMVSLIQSTYHGWGSHIVPEGLGFPIQNRGMLFSLDPAHRNRLEPGKRPFHTIIPAFLTKESEPVFAFGVMGGDFQPQGHAQMLMNILDFGMSPQQSGDRARAEHSGSSTPTGNKMEAGGVVRLERGMTAATAAGLEAKGHRIETEAGAFGGYQGIWRESGPRRYFGASDPRKDGCAMGY